MRVGEHWWPLRDRPLRGGSMSHEERVWREHLDFRGFRIFLIYSEIDHPHMFTGKGMDGIIDPGFVCEIMPPNRVRYSDAGVLKVTMHISQSHEDAPLTTDEIKVIGQIIDSINAPKQMVDARRKSKNDTRPRWKDDQRRMYDIKIHELIMDGKTNRVIANEIPLWAEQHPELSKCKIPGNTSLQKWAAADRKKNQEKTRRKRLPGGL